MQRFYAEKFLQITEVLSSADVKLRKYEDEKEVDEETRELFTNNVLKHLGTLSGDLGFIVLERYLNTAEREVKPGCSYREIKFATRTITNILRSEASTKLFLHVHADKVDLYLKPHPYGEDVEDKFPSAKQDILWAGQCLALDQPTAAVFHLMRVLEKGLTVLAKKLRVKFEYETWGRVCDQAEAKLRAISGKKKTKKQREQEQFYSEILAHYRNVKDAWRNHVTHARTAYDENQASAIYSHVREFMRRLGTKLAEKKDTRPHEKAIAKVADALVRCSTPKSLSDYVSEAWHGPKETP